jgi:tetratricopeptide (TPR) repeat protein
MRCLRHCLTDNDVRLSSLNCAAMEFFLAVVLGVIALVNVAGQQARPRPKPIRFFTIQGQVYLPEGRPATRVLVTIAVRGGAPRQIYTNEQGRFEFPNMEEGGYSLTARSLSDPNLISETQETDTSRTATSNLTVNLVLREASGSSERRKPGLIEVVEAEQKIPKEARKAFNEALKSKANSDTGKALEKLNQAIELFPTYFQALAQRGDLYIAQGKLIEAAADFERALHANSHYGPALRGSGYCKLEKHDFASAVKDFERSLTAEPDNASAYLLLGIANLELNQNELSRQALLRALGLGAIRAHIYLGNLYAREHQFRQAADELRLYLKVEPNAADAAQVRAIEAQWRSRSAKP